MRSNCWINILLCSKMAWAGLIYLQGRNLTIFPYMVDRVTEIEPLSEGEMEHLMLFKERAEDLAGAQRKYQNVPMASYSIDPAERVGTFHANTPDIDLVSNIAMKFRFFYAEKEPTQFEKIIGLLRRKAKDEWAVSYIERIALCYKHSMRETDTTASLGNPVANREMLNLWFNSKFFHSDKEKRAKLESIHQVVGKDVSLFQLYIALVKCSGHIQSLYLVVHKTTEDSLIVCTPNHHFRRSENT